MSTPNFEDMVFGDLARSFSVADRDNEEDTACADAIRGSLFKHQLSVLGDECRSKAVLCPRRSGKSHCAMSYGFDTCLRKPGARVVIVTLTLKHAKNIYWYQMAEFANKFGVKGVTFYQNELRVIFRNGSQMWLIGAESRAEIEKLRGGQYDLVVIDECKSYPGYILNELVYEVVFPALADRRGTIMLIGTPGNILSGLFFETTYPGWTDENGRPRARDFYKPEQYWADNPDDEYWSQHHWTVRDNIAQPHLWDEMLKRKKLAGWSDDEPIWQREALGRWVRSSEAFVYAFANMFGDPDKRADVTWQPDFKAGNQWGLAKTEEWRYLLGIDLGYNDHTALVVAAYNVHDGQLYFVWEYHAPELDIYDAIERVEMAWGLFGGFDAVVMDVAAGGKMLIETLNKRHGLAIKPADKTHKFDFIELMNADFRAGRTKLLADSDLARQMCMLQYDLSKGKFDMLAMRGQLKENPSMPNDLCDAALYVWRYSYHYWREDRPGQVIVPGTSEYYKMLHKNGIDFMLAERKRNATESNPHDPLKGYYN